MRSVLVHEGYVEEEVKPTELLDQYRRLTERDVRARLAGGTLSARACPGCGATDVASTGERFGLAYVGCASCGTLRVSPSPDDPAILAYYQESEAERFWRHELSRMTADSRRTRIVAPRMAWISDAVAEYLPAARVLADVHTNYAAYVPALAGLASLRRVVLADPLLPAAEVPDVPATDVAVGSLTDAGLAGGVDVVTLFEALDRTADVDALMERVQSVLRPGGLCFVTGILGSGFEYQVLGTRSANLLPPDRLNAFTVEGLQALVERHGFDVLELSTPGNFDVRTVEEALAADPSLPVPAFVSYLLRQRSQADKLKFQEFLQAALLSAYGRLVLKKR